MLEAASPPTIAIRLATSSIVWCLHRPQVMLSWCCGMVESLVIVFTFPVIHHELLVPILAVLHPN